MFESMSFQALLHFAICPALLFIVSRRVLRKSHKLTAEDVVVLAQRFTRACVAVSLVFGAVRTLVNSTSPDFAWSLLGTDPLARYWLEGTVLFYALDCVLLVFYNQWNFAMWLHHIFAILLFSVSLRQNMAFSGCIYSLLAEALVPWGFLLFYLRAVQMTRTLWFKVVCVMGMATLVFRLLLWVAVGLQHNVFGRSSEVMPTAFFWFVNMTVCVGFFLETSWLQLYWQNLKKSGHPMPNRSASMNQLPD